MSTKLRALAEAARDQRPDWYAFPAFVDSFLTPTDAAFVEAASPQIVIALLAEIGTLRQQVNAMAEVVAASNVLRNKHRDVFNDVSPNTDTGRWCMALDAFKATR